MKIKKSFVPRYSEIKIKILQKRKKIKKKKPNSTEYQKIKQGNTLLENFLLKKQRQSIDDFYPIGCQFGDDD